MKRILFLIVISAVSVLSYAQTEGPNNEVYFSYGTKPLIHIPTPELPSAPSDSKERRHINNERVSTIINIGYVYHITTPFAAGIQYSYGKVKGNVRDAISNKIGDMKNDCHTIMMTFKYDWLNTGRFRIYTRAAAGLMIIDGNLSSEENHLKPSFNSAEFDRKTFAWHISPVGLDWAFTKNMGLFMEGGIGYSGCGIAGIRVLF